MKLLYALWELLFWDCLPSLDPYFLNILHGDIKKPHIGFSGAEVGPAQDLALSGCLSNEQMSLLAGRPLISVSDGVSLREEAGYQGLSTFLGRT